MLATAPFCLLMWMRVSYYVWGQWSAAASMEGKRQPSKVGGVESVGVSGGGRGEFF